MIRRHITPACVAFSLLLTGCLLRLDARAASALAVVPAAAAVTLCGAAATAWPSRARRAGALAFAASIGIFLAGISAQRMSDAYTGAFLPVPPAQVAAFSGVVSQDSSLSSTGRTVLRLSLESASSARLGLEADARGRVLVFIAGDYRFSIGERLSIHTPLSPFDSTGPERFTARAQRGDVRSRGFSGPAWAFRAECREWLHGAVTAAGYPGSALLEALLIGAREDVPEGLYDAFLRTGSLHILALSGLHVTVLYGIVVGLLGFLPGRGGRFLLAALVILFYQFLAGFMPSLLRATVMIIVGGVAALLDRDGEPLNILSLSGILLLMVDPFQAFTLSFQLSFLALAGILVIGPLIQRPLEGRVPAFIALPLAMSVGAQVATLPLVVARFGLYCPSGLLAGLLLVPLTTGYLWAGLAWLPISAIPWPQLHHLCGRGFALFYDLIDGSARFFARLPGVPVGQAAVPWVAGGAALAMLVMGAALPWRRGALQGQTMRSTSFPVRRGARP